MSSFLFHESFHQLTKAPLDSHQALTTVAAAAGILLLIGLWTPLAGVIVALLETQMAFMETEGSWVRVLAAAIALGLALLGPGAWSIDARRYGRKRISIR